MKKGYYKVILLIFMINTVLVKAEKTEELGNVSREIVITGSNKYKSFLLDEEVYQYANENLSDLRIVDSTGGNISYYIEEGQPKEINSNSTQAISYSIKNEENQTSIRFKNEKHLKINSITLEIDGVFKRDYRAIGVNAKGENEWLEVGSIYNLEFKNSHTSDTEICTKIHTQYNEIKISIDNKDDAPLDIKEIKVSYEIDKVVFAADGKAPYMLWYGQPKALKPSYDIEEYKSYIQKEAQDLCSLREATVNQESGQMLFEGQNGQLLFNIFLVVTVGILVIILLKILKNN